MTDATNRIKEMLDQFSEAMSGVSPTPNHWPGMVQRGLMATFPQVSLSDLARLRAGELVLVAWPVEHASDCAVNNGPEPEFKARWRLDMDYVREKADEMRARVESAENKVDETLDQIKLLLRFIEKLESTHENEVTELRNRLGGVERRANAAANAELEMKRQLDALQKWAKDMEDWKHSTAEEIGCIQRFGVDHDRNALSELHKRVADLESAVRHNFNVCARGTANLADEIGALKRKTTFTPQPDEQFGPVQYEHKRVDVSLNGITGETGPVGRVTQVNDETVPIEMGVDSCPAEMAKLCDWLKGGWREVVVETEIDFDHSQLPNGAKYFTMTNGGIHKEGSTLWYSATAGEAIKHFRDQFERHFGSYQMRSYRTLYVRKWPEIKSCSDGFIVRGRFWVQ